MLTRIREKLKTYYKNTPLSYIDLIPRILINETMAIPMFQSWDDADKASPAIRYLALGASDVVATGSWPQSYANTILDVIKASGSLQKLENYQCSIWGSYARQIAEKLRLKRECHPNARFDFSTILVGYNDGLWNIPPDQFENDLENLVRQALLCCDYVYLLNAKDLKRMPDITGFPKFIETVYSNQPVWKYAERYQIKINKVVKRIDDPRLQVVDIRKHWYHTGETELTLDGLHPNIAGYNKIARIILAKIEENVDLMSRFGIDKIVI